MTKVHLWRYKNILKYMVLVEYSSKPIALLYSKALVMVRGVSVLCAGADFIFCITWYRHCCIFFSSRLVIC